MLVASRTGKGPPEILHYPDMPDDQRRRLHGTGRHTSISSLTVDEPATVEFTFTVGETPVANGGRLLVVWRWPFDWGDLQTSAPGEDGFVRWVGPTERDIELAIRYQWIAGIEPWHHQLEARLVKGDLREGDRVTLICGDRQSGGGGWSAPTCAARRMRFLMLIDHQGDHRRSRLVGQSAFPILADTPRHIALLAPSDAVVGEPFHVIVRGEDRWGNAATVPRGLQLSAGNAHVEPVEPPAGTAAAHYQVTVTEPQRLRLRIDDPLAPVAGAPQPQRRALNAVSNEVTVHAERPKWRLFWGDLHSGQTEIGCGAGSLAEHYAFARDCAGLQFITHQANDHYVTRDDWTQTRECTDAFDEPDRFTALLGCEWSPLTMAGGDRNVIYRRDEPALRRSGRFFEEAEPDPEPDLPTAPEFHQVFRELDVLVNIHVGGRPTNLDWCEPRIERLCEIHSTHGTSEWFVMEALRRGCIVGVTAGTDGVMGRPGACSPGRRLIRNVRNGLTAVYAERLTREGIWEALQQRRCFATSGPRMRLWFQVNGQPMGSQIRGAEQLEVRFEIQAEAPLERVELLRLDEVIHTWPIAAFDAADHDSAESEDNDWRRIRVLWGGTERRGTARLQRVTWDGALKVSGGDMELLEPLPLQSCNDRIEQASDAEIRWSSSTAGDHAGFVARVKVGAALHFHSPPAEFDASLAEVCERAVTRDAGGVGRYVTIGPAPRRGAPSDFKASHLISDHTSTSQPTPYWLRVIRLDQARAWSSPVYVE